MAVVVASIGEFGRQWLSMHHISTARRDTHAFAMIWLKKYLSAISGYDDGDSLTYSWARLICLLCTHVRSRFHRLEASRT